MASFGQIIFWGMIVLIFIISGLIILILALAFSVSNGFVESSDLFPVGNLGQDVILHCRFNPSSGTGVKMNDVSITWEKKGLSGVVYQYKNGAAQLKDQNPLFTERTQLFTDFITLGNASLLLRSVRMEDAGVYQCSVSAPASRGTISVHLRVAAFSAPTFTISNTSLTAEAQRWLPKPDVSWSDYAGNPLNASTHFYNNSAGILRIVSTLQDPVRMDDTYTCVIQNILVKAVSQATLTDDMIYSGCPSRYMNYRHWP
ncbi:V-set domain-containing T-cell activation inhibitor 1 [Chanos chanos]|uniref:V-set domain-containing T-cell activation inhibitor 1 n=1 Tax=Chanos chanos TaxID=29144 RepID=A0A6J2WJD9_CHACN|nr:V-set domain-containing T-cell activation inhibitor 1 [Chanos chanos]